MENPKILEIAPINQYGSPQEIINFFGGVSEYKDAVKDLRLAFEKGLLPNSLTDEKYFNIKRMSSIQLK